MQRSPHRILTIHIGSLPRPDDLLEMLMAREQGRLHGLQAFQARERTSSASPCRFRSGRSSAP
jgi:methionine synthase II (cobalamin-independent)